MKSTKFFIKMLAVFFTRVKPASTNAKPGCMKNTSMAARSIHIVLSPFTSSPKVSGAASSVAVCSVTAITVVDRLSAVAVFCAKVSVAMQIAIRTAPAIHSLAMLRFLYLSISFLLFVVLVFFVFL